MGSPLSGFFLIWFYVQRIDLFSRPPGVAAGLVGVFLLFLVLWWLLCVGPRFAPGFPPRPGLVCPSGVAVSEEVQLVLQASALEKGQLRAILSFPDPF